MEKLAQQPAFPATRIERKQAPSGTQFYEGFIKPGMTLHQHYVGTAMQALHGQIADIFTSGLVPPDRQSEEETRAYYEKRVKQIAKTCVDIADATIAELESRQ